MYKKYLSHIHRAITEQRLCIFVGAGISKASGNMPDWSELVQGFKSDLGETKETDFLKIAQLYYLEFGEYVYYEKLKSLFLTSASPADVHHLILNLEPDKIITTNWDCLLEQEIENNVDLYDVIASDDDLVKSNNVKKLIKMHGDFAHHNLVFKEDDYLSYEHNFPLISNYIKGMLSTYTFLFLGYSYNDINLKIIMSWIGKHTSVRQPLYLLAYEENRAQMMYLQNHGITTIIAPAVNDDSYTKRTEIFLHSLIHYEQELNVETLHPVEVVYNKLKVFKDFECVLVSQIQNALKSCGFIYGENNILLIFYDNSKNHELNKIGAVYSNFINIIASKDELPADITAKLQAIYNVLNKAGINGIILSMNKPDYTGRYVDFEFEKYSHLENVISFNYTLSTISDDLYDLSRAAHILYLQSDYNNSFELVKRSLRIAISQKDYPQVVMLSSNLGDLSHIINFVDFDSTISVSHVFKKAEAYYNAFPHQQKLACKDIYYSLGKGSLNEFAKNSSEALREANKKRKILQGGGFYSSRDEYRNRQVFCNTLRYYLGNQIMIEKWSEFKGAVRNYIDAIFVGNNKNDKIVLNRYEVYALVVFYSPSQIKDLFDEYSVVEQRYIQLISITPENVAWMIDGMLNNLVNARPDDLRSSQDNWSYIANVLWILSFIYHDNKTSERILSIINQAIGRTSVSISFYEAVNRFVAIQHTLFKNEDTLNYERIKDIIESLINKYSMRKANGYETMALFSNGLSNLYAAIVSNEFRITNIKAIKRILLEFDDADIKQKSELADSLLINLLHISDDAIKAEINAFIDNLLLECSESPSLNGVRLAMNLSVGDYSAYNERMKTILERFANKNECTEPEYLVDLKLTDLVNYLFQQHNDEDLKCIYDRIMDTYKNKYTNLQDIKLEKS